MSPRRDRAPTPDALRLLRERAILFLEGQPSPVSSALLAREVMGLRHGSEQVCAAILGPALSGDPRLGRTEDGRWHLRDEAPGPPAGSAITPRAWSWAVWAATEDFRSAAVVRLEAGRIVEERCEPPDSLEIFEGDDAPGPAGAGRPGVHGDPPEDERASAEGPLGAGALRRLAIGAANALWTSWDAGPMASRLAALTRAAEEEAAREGEGRGDGAEGPAQGLFPLAGLARAVLGPPRPRTLEHLAASLDLVFVEPDAPLARARLAAECLLVLLEREPLAAARDARELRARAGSGRGRSSPAASGGADPIAPAGLEDLPAEPGVYRFFDSRGRLLYVGKSQDLRRRVGSYFAVRERADPRTESWLARVDRIEHERTGSDLEALLREADQITSRAPAANRQRTVHPRRGKELGHLALVQRAERPGAIRVLLVRDGALAARLLLGPRGGGGVRLRELVARLYFSTHAAPSGKRGSSGRQGAARALVLSWLKRQDPAVPAIDPTDDAGPDQACARILAHAAALRRGESGVFYR